jgi:hypothetical protein
MPGGGRLPDSCCSASKEGVVFVQPLGLDGPEFQLAARTILEPLRGSHAFLRGAPTALGVRQTRPCDGHDLIAEHHVDIGGHSSAPTRSWVQAVASSGVARSRPGLGGIGGAVLSSLGVLIVTGSGSNSPTGSAATPLHTPCSQPGHSSLSRPEAVIVPLDVSRGCK